MLSRSWLLDPVRSQASSAASTSDDITDPWNGEFYCSFGEGESRSWADAVEYGFISAGGGQWYTRTLGALKPGDRIWVKIPDQGFVGVGRVTRSSTLLHPSSGCCAAMETKRQCSMLPSGVIMVASFWKTLRGANTSYLFAGWRQCPCKRRSMKLGYLEIKILYVNRPLLSGVLPWSDSSRSSRGLTVMKKQKRVFEVGAKATTRRFAGKL